MLSDSTLNKLVKFLKDVKGWTDLEIVQLILYITEPSKKK